MQIVHLDLFRWLFCCGACSSDPSTGKGNLNTVSYIWYQYTELGCVRTSRRQWVAGKIWLRFKISPVKNAGLICSHGTGFAFSNIPHRFRMWRCRPEAAMVMKMKRTSSLDISVAKSGAKLDASDCHSLVGSVATSAVMKLIPAPISDTNSKDSRNCEAVKHLFSIKTILISKHNHVSSYTHPTLRITRLKVPWRTMDQCYEMGMKKHLTDFGPMPKCAYFSPLSMTQETASAEHRATGQCHDTGRGG